MLLLDVNILVEAYVQDVPRHAQAARWLEELVNSPLAFGVADLVLSGFLRVVTHPRIFKNPAPIEKALEFAELIRGRPQCVPVNPGPRHWGIFTSLCRTAGVRGNLVPDAYLAALAIESGSEWITADRDYARFPNLRWRTPF